MSRALDIATARAAEAQANRARYPVTASMLDELRAHFPNARLAWTDENGGRGNRGSEGVIASPRAPKALRVKST